MKMERIILTVSLLLAVATYASARPVATGVRQQMPGPRKLYITISGFNMNQFPVDTGSYITGVNAMLTNYGANKWYVLPTPEHNMEVTVSNGKVSVDVLLIDQNAGYVPTLITSITAEQVAMFVTIAGLRGSGASVHMSTLKDGLTRRFWCQSSGAGGVPALCPKAG
mmetsp:Transcript_25492/g.55442  ORF Transcript_25492/g.55442 Transcript_25492/m.55442 type:complete len:167 (-) Transcript_25492:1844-2344(-)